MIKKRWPAIIAAITAAIYLGKAGLFFYQNPQFTDFWDWPGHLEKAMEKARNLAQPGDAVLLSPGCASFSMFMNEFERGEQFNHIVRQWQKEKTSL